MYHPDDAKFLNDRELNLLDHVNALIRAGRVRWDPRTGYLRGVREPLEQNDGVHDPFVGPQKRYTAGPPPPCVAEWGGAPMSLVNREYRRYLDAAQAEVDLHVGPAQPYRPYRPDRPDQIAAGAGETIHDVPAALYSPDSVMLHADGDDLVLVAVIDDLHAAYFSRNCSSNMSIGAMILQNLAGEAERFGLAIHPTSPNFQVYRDSYRRCYSARVKVLRSAVL